MAIYSLIVTYSNRFHLLSKVIEASFNEGVDRIIVVDNNSDRESREPLKQLEADDSRITVLFHNQNLGSAGGYKSGLEHIVNSCPDCEYIWMLDDDNKPEQKSLKIIREYWVKNKLADSRDALMSYRPDRTAYKIAVMTENPDHVLERADSFWGFHILNIPKKITKVMLRRLGRKTFNENPDIRSGEIAVGTYGGMFFHKSLIEEIGYPDESYFVYADDHQWTYRITKTGGKIYLILDSLLEDIDTSWNVPDKKQTVFDVIGKGSDFRIYYSVRNRILFERENLVRFYPLYRFNLYLFEFLFNIIARKKNYKTGSILHKAINDGLRGIRGITQ